jgi:hypothetical protein
MGGSERSVTGTGWNRFGPTRREGDARDPHTGSVKTRYPSISIMTVEWPSQVARRPVPGVFDQVSRGFVEGNGARGTRRSSPHRKSDNEGDGALASRRSGSTGCTLRKPSPAQSGEDRMRSSRKPSGFPPRDFISISPML